MQHLRLVEERTRLELTQSQVAAVCGVTLRSQQNYENGRRSPDMKYLSDLAGAGADVLYIVTGQRAGGGAVQALDREDRLDLELFKNLSKADRAAMRRQAEALVQVAHAAAAAQHHTLKKRAA